MPAVSAQQSEPPLLPAPDHDMNNGPWFQMVCTLGDRRHDDPIVFPGQPGVSHEHQFFGAKSVTAFGSYAKLSTGGTTCNDKADTAAYWVPVLYDEQGVVRSPKRVRAYYFANTSDRNTLRAFPPNLRIIAGDGRATSTQPQGVIHWQCRNRRDQSAGRPLASANPPRCDRDEYLSLGIRFPDCWDGVNLDSSDHRRHMAYADTRMRCPSTHPVKLPKLRLSITYEDGAFTGGNFTLGAPRGHHHALPTTAMHADFWNTWRQSALEEFVEGCLKRGRSVRATSCQR
ncbi:MAG TPA: DUF1996 domain-containing protein [Roseiflexaceae bacterium]|nr:DUF1996 domain-containing protein [Roseiflexaceae bacterium]